MTCGAVGGLCAACSVRRAARAAHCVAMAERPELSSMCFGFGGCEWRAKSAKLATSKMRCEVRLGKLRAACDMRRAYSVRHATVCRVLEVCF